MALMVLIVAYRAHQTTANQGIKPVTQIATVIQLGPRNLRCIGPLRRYEESRQPHLHYQGSLRLKMGEFLTRNGLFGPGAARPRGRKRSSENSKKLEAGPIGGFAMKTFLRKCGSHLRQGG